MNPTYVAIVVSECVDIFFETKLKGKRQQKPPHNHTNYTLISSSSSTKKKGLEATQKMAKLIELEHTHFNFHYCLPDQTHFLHLLARFFSSSTSHSLSLCMSTISHWVWNNIKKPLAVEIEIGGSLTCALWMQKKLCLENYHHAQHGCIYAINSRQFENLKQQLYKSPSNNIFVYMHIV